MEGSQERYNEVKNEVGRMLRMVGYKVDKIPFVPTSGWTGDNLVKLSDKMAWYKGPTLIEALDFFEIPPKPLDKPLRIPVQDVYSIKFASGNVITINQPVKGHLPRRIEVQIS
jgi:elongation factor 1-alpha